MTVSHPSLMSSQWLTIQPAAAPIPAAATPHGPRIPAAAVARQIPTRTPFSLRPCSALLRESSPLSTLATASKTSARPSKAPTRTWPTNWPRGFRISLNSCSAYGATAWHAALNASTAAANASIALGAASSSVHFASGASTLSKAQLRAPPIISASPENASRTRAAAARSGSKLMLAIRSLMRCSAFSSFVDDSATSSSSSPKPPRTPPPAPTSVVWDPEEPPAAALLSDSLFRISKLRTLFAASFAAPAAPLAESSISSKDSAALPAPADTVAVLLLIFFPKTFAIA